MRPSELLEIKNNSQVALDLDLACAETLLESDNKRELKRLESLIKSLAVLLAPMMGADPEKVARSLREEAEDEAENGPANDEDEW